MAKNMMEIDMERVDALTQELANTETNADFVKVSAQLIKAMGETPLFDSFEEFDEMMLSGKPLKF